MYEWISETDLTVPISKTFNGSDDASVTGSCTFLDVQHISTASFLKPLPFSSFQSLMIEFHTITLHSRVYSYYRIGFDCLFFALFYFSCLWLHMFKNPNGPFESCILSNLAFFLGKIRLRTLEVFFFNVAKCNRSII
jgi:hypothetical protein